MAQWPTGSAGPADLTAAPKIVPLALHYGRNFQIVQNYDVFYHFE